MAAYIVRDKRDAEDHDRDDDENPKQAKLDLTNFEMLPKRIRCPRCFSLNTKFCYFNNHNLGQPRFLCRACRRYWTHGGALRNVPVGGGYRRRNRVFPPRRPSTIIIQPQPWAPPQPPTIPESFGQLPQRVTNMAAMVTGVSGIPSVAISFLDPPTMIPIYPNGTFSVFEGRDVTQSREQRQGNPTNPPLRIGGVANSPPFAGFQFSTLQALLNGLQGQVFAPRYQAQVQGQGQGQGQIQPPLQIHDEQPVAPPQIDLGGSGQGGGRNKDKQPMYQPDETAVLPGETDEDNRWTGAENNTNVASTSRGNYWSNTNGASTSTGLTECSVHPNDEWPLDDDDELPNAFLGDRC